MCRNYVKIYWWPIKKKKLRCTGIKPLKSYGLNVWRKYVLRLSVCTTRSVNGVTTCTLKLMVEPNRVRLLTTHATLRPTCTLYSQETTTTIITIDMYFNHEYWEGLNGTITSSCEIEFVLCHVYGRMVIMVIMYMVRII